MSGRLCAVLIFAAALLRAQAARLTAAEFPFRIHEGLLWLAVTIPQSEKPLNFLLDSGAGVSVVNLATARQLGLKPGRKVTVAGVQATLPGYWPERMAAAIGKVALPREYLAVDLGKLGRSCQRPVDGLLGADFFRGRVVEIDFDAQVVRLLAPRKRAASANVLPLQLRPGGMRVPVRVNGGQPQWLRVDTGCATALQWVTGEVRPEPCGGKPAVGLAALSIPQARTAVALGTAAFQDVPTGIHREPIFPGEAGLLGNGLLSRFKTVTLDAVSGQILFGELRGQK